MYLGLQSLREKDAAMAGQNLNYPAFSLSMIGREVWGLGFGVWGLGFGVWGLGFGVWGLGFGVWRFYAGAGFESIGGSSYQRHR